MNVNTGDNTRSSVSVQPEEDAHRARLLRVPTARPTRRREEVPTRKVASAHTPSRHATAPFFPAAPAARWRPVAAVAAATAAATTAVELAAGRGIGGGNGGTSPGATK